MPLLSMITYAPLLGLVGILVLRLMGKPEDPATAAGARWIALITTLATLALSVLLVARFNPNDPGFQFVEEVPGSLACITGWVWTGSQCCSCC